MFIRASQITKCNVANTHGRHAFSFFNWDSRTVALRVLLDAGADKEARDYLGQSPLHLASVHDDLDCLGILLDFGADLEAKDDFIHTPLHLAAWKGMSNTLVALLEAGAQVDAKDKQVSNTNLSLKKCNTKVAFYKEFL